MERGDEASLAYSASTDDDGGKHIEEQALRLTSEEIYDKSARRFKGWAYDAKALRMGEVILIVDSDTIVPEVSCSQIELASVFQC